MRFQIEECIVDTKSSTESWSERRYCDGSNLIGRSSRSQWHDETLYRSRKGRYYVVTTTRIDKERDRAEWMSPEEATRWLLLNDYDLPTELQKVAEEVTE